MDSVRRWVVPDGTVERRAIDVRVFNVKVILMAAILAVTSSAAVAADPREAQQLVKETTRELLEVLRNEAADGEVDPATVRSKLDELILPHLDFITMTKLAVGRHWLQADREQKRSLVRQFRTLLVSTYTRSLSEYNDQALEFLPLQPGQSDNRTKVRSRVKGKDGAKIPVEYSMRHHDGQWQVYDIAVDGISLVTTYRSSFSEIVAREGIDGLINHLERKNAGNAEAAS